MICSRCLCRLIVLQTSICHLLTCGDEDDNTKELLSSSTCFLLILSYASDLACCLYHRHWVDGTFLDGGYSRFGHKRLTHNSISVDLEYRCSPHNRVGTAYHKDHVRAPLLLETMTASRRHNAHYY